MRHVIEQALDRLSPRRRDIVRRCDLLGEPHPAVASSLGISERHFYRERRLAFDFLASELVRARNDSLPSGNAGDDSVALALSFAEASHQVGDVRRAMRVLTAVREGLTQPEPSLRIECRLAELACDVGDARMAAAHLAAARECGARTAPSQQTAAQARSDAAESAVAWRSGRPELAVACAERSLALLLQAPATATCGPDAEALAVASLVLSEWDLTHGRWRSSRRRAVQAHRALATAAAARIGLGIRAQSAETLAAMFESGNVTDAAFSFDRQYHAAIGRGLLLEAVLAGWRLFYCHRFAGKNREAIALIESMLPVAGELMAPEESAQMALDLASAHLSAGDFAKARRRAADVQDAIGEGQYAAPRCYLIGAEAHLLERNYPQALNTAQSALEALRSRPGSGSFHYVSLGLPEAGWAMRVQAEAKHAMGDWAEARTLIAAALEHVHDSSHPRIIAKTHLAAARITGKSEHRRIANRLMGRSGQSH